jgi:hypothetical protein
MFPLRHVNERGRSGSHRTNTATLACELSSFVLLTFWASETAQGLKIDRFGNVPPLEFEMETSNSCSVTRKLR